ncbi:MAG: L,D-transpeptidase [Porticoccaceae bacterium]
MGQSKIVAKHKDPAWFVPKSIRDEHIQQGETEFPEYFPPGPNNPMGMLAIQTGFLGIYIHGTNRPWGVGMRTSHGCLHLYPEDAAILFPLMTAGIPLRVIDEPFVVGHLGRDVVMTSYEPVAESGASTNLFTRAVLALLPYLEPDAAEQSLGYDVAWGRVQEVVGKKTLVPMSVSPGGRSIEEVIAEIRAEAYAFPPYGVDANDASLPGQ